MPERMEELKQRFASDEDIEIQTDFSSNSTVFEADMMITDWSGIAYEYAYTTCKPVLFIDTPMKVMNPEYKKIDVEPINIWMRESIGATLKPDEMDKVPEVVEEMLNNADKYKDRIEKFVNEYVYNLGHSAEVGAEYIIGEVIKKYKKRKIIKAGGFKMFNSIMVGGYIDPSVMTYAIQAIAGVVIAVGAAVGIYWRKAKKKVNEKLGIDENRNKEVESDDIVVNKASTEDK